MRDDVALDLFGPPDREEEQEVGGKARRIRLFARNKGALLNGLVGCVNTTDKDDRTTGGRRAVKTQRRISFSIHRELEESLLS